MCKKEFNLSEKDDKLVRDNWRFNKYTSTQRHTIYEFAKNIIDMKNKKVKEFNKLSVERFQKVRNDSDLDDVIEDFKKRADF